MGSANKYVLCAVKAGSFSLLVRNSKIIKISDFSVGKGMQFDTKYIR